MNMEHCKNKKGICAFSLRLMALLAVLVAVSCGVEDNDTGTGGGIYNNSGASSGGVYGTYEGKWKADNRALGTAVLKVDSHLEFSGLPLTELLSNIVTKEEVASAAVSAAGDAYRVPFIQTAYSATSLYFNITKLDYTFVYTLEGTPHEVEVVMAATGSVAVYDKQNGSFVVLLKVIGFTVDGVKTANYGKEQTLMFNSTARRSAK